MKGSTFKDADAHGKNGGFLLSDMIGFIKNQVPYNHWSKYLNQLHKVCYNLAVGHSLKVCLTLRGVCPLIKSKLPNWSKIYSCRSTPISNRNVETNVPIDFLTAACCPRNSFYTPP